MAAEEILKDSAFEDRWNRVLVDEIRASLARSPDRRSVRAVAECVARLEPSVRSTRISTTAWQLRRKWNEAAQRKRIAAAEAESLARATRSAPAYGDSLFELALSLYEQLGDSRRHAWVLGGMGAAAVQRGDYERADRLLRRSVDARRELGDERMLGNSLYDLGLNSFRRGEHARAWEFLSESRAIRERTGQLAQLGSTLDVLGRVKHAEGEMDSAQALFERALSATVEGGDSLRTRVVLMDHARLEQDRLRFRKAESLLDRAGASMREEDPLRPPWGSQLGELLARAGRYSEAIEVLERAVQGFEELGEVHSRAAALLNLGFCWASLGDLPKTKTALTEVLDYAEGNQAPDLEARALNNLSMALRVTGDLTGARAKSEAALRAAIASGDSSVVREVVSDLGVTHLLLGNASVAASCFRRAIGAARAREFEALEQRLNLCVAQIGQGDYEAAGRALTEILGTAEDAGAVDLASYAHMNLSHLARIQGDPAGALAHARAGVQLVDSLRSHQGTADAAIRFMGTRADEYEAIIDLLVRLSPSDRDKAEEAFHWAERSHARTLLDRIRPERHVTIRMADVQSRIAPDEALLEYSVGDSSSTLWVLRRDRWAVHVLPGRNRLRALVRTMRLRLSADVGSSRALAAQAERMYEVLLAPAARLLAGVGKLIVVPDDALSLLPFEILRIGGRNASWCGERFAFRYLPAASFLEVDSNNECQPVIVAVTDPLFDNTVMVGGEVEVRSSGPDSSRLRPLPGTAREAAVLRTVASPRTIVELSGANASRERLLALPELQRAQIIHLGTHAWSSEYEPERSALWLAPDSLGPGEPSALTMKDILSLQLCADQVTLAACESGVGQIARGEGVVSLARGFLSAGAQSVLVSLWPVNDLVTAYFMETFYRELLSRGASRSEAVARARRSVMKGAMRDAPFYWGAFVLVGNGGGLSATAAAKR